MTATVGQDRFTPSPIFGALVAATFAVGLLLWRGSDLGGFGVFIFVLLGWTLSLTLHEFGHAIVAYIAGDRSVADKGYLTLDVRKYVDPGTSLIFPLIILVIGGIGLPGGAVWIQMGAIRSAAMRSAVSAAGPAASAVCALLCLVPIRMGLFDGADRIFLVAMGFLGAIQVIAFLLNLIPIPGLDGFGIIEPHLSPQTRAQLRPLRQYGFMILIAALWFVEPVSDAFWGVTESVSDLLGGENSGLLRSLGWREFRFWE